jgi:hypothetical protein
MANILKYSGVAALVLIIVLGVKLFMPSTVKFGAAGGMLAENYDPYIRYNGGFNTNLPETLGGLVTATAGALFSSVGTQLNGFNFGTCYIQASATTITASSTVTVDCQGSTTGGNTALTGVTTNDNVSVNFATTTSTTYSGLSILGASASSTPGYITMKVFNGTGTTFTWSAGASTTQYRAYR